MRLFRRTFILLVFFTSLLVALLILAGPSLLGFAVQNVFEKGTGCKVSLSHPKFNLYNLTASIQDVEIHCKEEIHSEGFFAERVSTGIDLSELFSDRRVIFTPLTIEGARVESLISESAFLRTLEFVIPSSEDETSRNFISIWVPLVVIEGVPGNSLKFGMRDYYLSASNVYFTARDSVDNKTTAVILEAETSNLQVILADSTMLDLGMTEVVAEVKQGKLLFSDVESHVLESAEGEDLVFQDTFKVGGSINVRTGELDVFPFISVGTKQIHSTLLPENSFESLFLKGHLGGSIISPNFKGVFGGDGISLFEDSSCDPVDLRGEILVDRNKLSLTNLSLGTILQSPEVSVLISDGQYQIETPNGIEFSTRTFSDHLCKRSKADTNITIPIFIDGQLNPENNVTKLNISQKHKDEKTHILSINKTQGKLEVNFLLQESLGLIPKSQGFELNYDQLTGEVLIKDITIEEIPFSFVATICRLFSPDCSMFETSLVKQFKVSANGALNYYMETQQLEVEKSGLSVRVILGEESDTTLMLDVASREKDFLVDVFFLAGENLEPKFLGQIENVSGKLSGALKLVDFDISEMLHSGEHSLAGQVSISGALSKPEVSVDFNLASLFPNQDLVLPSKLSGAYTSTDFWIKGSVLSAKNNFDFKSSDGKTGILGTFNFEEFPLEALVDVPSSISQLSVVLRGELRNDRQLSSLSSESESQGWNGVSAQVELGSIKVNENIYQFDSGNGVVANINREGLFIHPQTDKLGNVTLSYKLDLDWEGKMGGLVEAEGSFRMPASVLNPIEDFSGQLRGAVSIGGTLFDPTCGGGLDVIDGLISVAFEHTVVGLEDLSGSLKCRSNHLLLENLHATFGGGDFVGGGSVDFDEGGFSNASLIFKGSEILISPTPELAVQLDADLHLSQKPDGMLLKGNIDVQEAIYEKEVTIQTILREITQALISTNGSSRDLTQSIGSGIEFDLNIMSNGNILVDTSVLEAELAANLTVTGEGNDTRVRGEIEVIDGSFKINQTQFSVVSGVITFDEDFRSFDPNVRVLSEGDLRLRTGDTEKIFLSLLGTLNEPKVLFRSDSGLPPREIVKKLGVGSSGNQLYLVKGGSGSRRFRELLSPESDIGFSERFAGLTGFDEIRLETAVAARTGDFVPQIVASRPLPLKLRGSIWSELAATRASGGKVSYSLSPLLSVFGAWRSQSVTQASGSNGSNFSLGFQFKDSFQGLLFLDDRVKEAD